VYGTGSIAVNPLNFGCHLARKSGFDWPSGAPFEFEVPAVRLIPLPLPTEVSSWGESRHSHKANATWIRSLGFLYVLTE
jgi:hypothetical protein